MNGKPKPELIALAAGIASTYVTNNSVPPSELPHLISAIYTALVNASEGLKPLAAEPRKSAVNPKRSVQPDYIVCLEDGAKFKSLKRHIQAAHDLSPEKYREKWGLPSDYPMVAPNYALNRSILAKKIGLGKSTKKKGSRGAPQKS